MSYRIKDKENYYVVLDDEGKFYSKHKTRFSASESLFKRMVRDATPRKRKAKVIKTDEQSQA